MGLWVVLDTHDQLSKISRLIKWGCCYRKSNPSILPNSNYKAFAIFFYMIVLFAIFAFPGVWHTVVLYLWRVCLCVGSYNNYPRHSVWRPQQRWFFSHPRGFFMLFFSLLIYRAWAPMATTYAEEKVFIGSISPACTHGQNICYSWGEA